MKERNKSFPDENQQLLNNKELDYLRMQIMREILELNEQDALEDILSYMRNLMLPEDSSLSAQEPQLSYGTRANDVRVHIMQESILMEDKTLLTYSLNYIVHYIMNYNYSQPSPCQYSIEELKLRLKMARKAAKTKTYKTQAEMRSKHPL